MMTKTAVIQRAHRPADSLKTQLKELIQDEEKDMELYNSLEESLFRPFCTLDTAAAAAI